MAIVDELISSFEAVNVTLGSEVLEKCRELCTTYRLDVEDFVDQWFAYTASHLNGAPPSVVALEQLERKELQKQARMDAKIHRQGEIEINVETTPKTPRSRPRPPEQSPQVSRIESDTNDPHTPSQRYMSRSDSRSIQCEYGDCPHDAFKRTDCLIDVRIQGADGANVKYMYERLGTRAECLNDVTRWVSNEILTYHKLQLTNEPLAEYFGDVVACGRVYPANSAKLNAQSIVLEGLLEMDKGHSVPLNVANLEKVVLFSGQIVVVQGNNQKNSFTVERIYTGAPLLSPALPMLHQPLQVVVASGPFTLPDNLLYEPLNDLISYVTEYKPNLLVLMGPFIDRSHPLIDTIGETFDFYFEKLVEDLMRQLEDAQVKVVMIPSHKDVHNHVVFPALPYKLQQRYDNVVFAPNPCVLDVDGVLIGATSADVLFHLYKQEFCMDKNPKGPTDKMARIASHLLNQRSFYPLHPPDPDIRIDFQLLERFGLMETMPHLLFLPSNFRHFVKKVDGCLVVNPERLAKGNVAGTFARLEIRPGEGPVCDRVLCQILRV